MGLKFILGRAGSGKTTLALKQISEKQENNPEHNLILMVPEQFSLQAEKDIIKETKGRGIMQAKVLSFHRLAYTVFKETTMPKNVNLTDITRTVALKKIVIDLKEKFLYFKTAAEKQGFMEQLKLTITELFGYCISEENLFELIEKTTDNPVLKDKLKDLYLIYSKYKEFLEDGFVASEETLDILYHRLEKSNLIGGAHIWLDGFYGFTPQEFKIIEKLICRAASVTIVLTMDEYALNKNDLPMTHVFFETKDTYLKLSELAKDCGAAIENTILNEQKRFKNNALSALENEYTKSLIKRQNEHEGIEVFAASNIFSEAEYVAWQITKLVRDKGFRYRDIAVLAASLSDYEDVLRITMNECKIPFFMDIKHETENHPLTEFVKGMIEAVLYNLSFDSVFSFLKTGLSPMERDDIEVLENYCLAYGIKSYKWKAENWSYGFTNNNNSEEYIKINSLKNEFLEILSPFISIDTKKNYTVSEFAEKIFEVFEKCQIELRLNEMVKKMIGNGNLDKAMETKQCWNIIVDTIDALVLLLGEEKLKLKDFYELFESGITAGKLKIIPPALDNITIGNIERTRLPKIKALFLIGVNDGVIPSVSGAEGLFLDDERSVLESLGVNLAHDNVRRAFEENFLIYSSITKASNNLFITYSAGDLSGKTLLPSTIIQKIQRIFPSLPVKNEVSHEDLFSLPALAFHRLGDGLKAGEAAWSTALDFFENSPLWKERTKLIKEGLNAVSPKDFLNEETKKKFFGEVLYTSVSRLERFSSCPYSYFLTYTMKAKERKLYEIGTPDLGLLFHSVLEDFSYTLKENNINWRELNKPQVCEIIEKSVDRQAPSLVNEILLSTGAMKYLIKRLKRICIRAVWTLTSHLKDGSFALAAYELNFSEGGVLPPIAIEFENGDKMFLTGKIDRVDILKADETTFVKIIDYKSGNKDFSLQEVYYGLQLQLLIYLDALLKNGQSIFGDNLMPAGVFYFKIKDPMIMAEESIDFEDIEELLMKKLKMSGLVLNNEKVINALDTSTDRKSKIIPVERNAKGGFSASSSLADEKMYERLREYSVDKAKEIGKRIKDGEISVKPYRFKGRTPCDYCQYISVCGFEEGENYTRRNLKNITSKEVMEKIKGD